MLSIECTRASRRLGHNLDCLYPVVINNLSTYMAKINYLDDVGKTQTWPIIGKGWKSANGDGISIAIGNKVKDGDVLKDRFSEITLKADDRLYLQPNQNKRGGDHRDPDYVVKLVMPNEEADKTEEKAPEAPADAEADKA